MRGRIVWLNCAVSLSPVCIVSHDPFSVFSDSFQKLALQHVFEKEGIRLMTVPRRWPALFFLVCKAYLARKTLNPCCHESKRILLRD
jgi:hypothetical protein